MRKAGHRRLRGAIGAALVTGVLATAGCGGSGGDGGRGVPVQVTATEGGVATDAVLVAFQDGAGPWQSVPVTRAGGYTGYVKSPDGKFGIAVVQGASNQRVVNVFYATTAEVVQVPVNRVVSGTPSGWGLSGTITGIAGGEGTVFVPGRSASRVTDGAYSTTIRPGANDFLAVRSGAEGSIDKYLIRREPNVQSDVVWNIDFADPVALNPSPFRVTCAGAPDAYVSWSLLTKAGAFVARGGTGEVEGKALPVAARDPSDLYVLSCSRSNSGASDSTSRASLVATATPADTVLNLPAAVSASITTGTTAPYARVRGDWTWTVPATGVMVHGGSAQGTWYVVASAGWLGSGTSLQAPDLTGAPGWQPAWNPSSIVDGGVVVLNCSSGMSGVASHFAGGRLPSGTALQTSSRRFW